MKVIILIILLGLYFIPFSWGYLLLVLLAFLWFGLVIGAVIYIWWNYDREYKPRFQEEIIKEPPLLRKPEELGYLLKQKIIPKHFTAVLMDLIRRGVILVEEEPPKVFFLIHNNHHNENLNKAESFLLIWLFKRIGDGERVSINTILRDAKKNSGYFWSCAREWFDIATFSGEKECFFESKRVLLEETFGYFGLSLVLIAENILIHHNFYLITAMIFVIMVAAGYIFNFQRRTVAANEEYYQWLALGRYVESSNSFAQINDADWLANLIIYAKLLNKEESFYLVLKEKVKAKQVLLENKLIALEVNGVLRLINKRLEKALPRAKFKAWFLTTNKGSQATCRYKKNK